MSVTDDALKAKFSTLNETQDSIVSVANWMMFHRRHADRVVQAWFTRLRDVGSPKRLNLIYLANEVVQQSKLRHRTELPDAFSPIIADAVQLAYKGAPSDVQQKIRRVVEVWRARGVFETPIVDATEARLDDMDKNKTSGKKPLMGGSLFSTGKGSIPKELENLASLQTNISKAKLSSTTASSTADGEYDKLNGPDATLPSPPVHAARLSSLVKALANAESSVSESIKARKELITELEKLLEINKAELAKEEAQQVELASRKSSSEAKKRDVEDAIMRGMSANHTNGGSQSIHGGENSETDDLERPEFEALTPPPVEALTPPPVADDSSTPSVSLIEQVQQGPNVPENADISSLLAAMSGGPFNPSPSSNTAPLYQPQEQQAAQQHHQQPFKKRKMSHHGDEIPGFNAGGDAMADLDDEVAELLRQESAKAV